MAVLTGYVTITSFGSLVLFDPRTEFIDTGISDLQALWLTGYRLTYATGTAALQSVLMRQGVGGTWVAYATVCALTSDVTDAAVQVFYAYSA